MSAGKGSSPRPYSVSQDEFAVRWDAIFRKPAPEVDHAQHALELQQRRTHCSRCGKWLGDGDSIHTCTPKGTT